MKLVLGLGLKMRTGMGTVMGMGARAGMAACLCLEEHQGQRRVLGQGLAQTELGGQGWLGSAFPGVITTLGTRTFKWCEHCP